jgi:hypothetical protein
MNYSANADDLFFFDYFADPGIHSYTVTANYDLTSYGNPGQFGQSVPAGPVTITLPVCGALPFFEKWDAGTFSFNSWHFSPSQGNWVVDVSQGNPLPSAKFRGSPAISDYSSSLISISQSGITYSGICADITLEFDLNLEDLLATASEILSVEIYYDNVWHVIGEFSNTGSMGWTHFQYSIPEVIGKAYRIGFRAHGSNTGNVNGWYIDNILTLAHCAGPLNCQISKNANVVSLSWEDPCDSLQALMGYNIFRSETNSTGPYSKVNSSFVAGNQFDDHIPTGYPYHQFWYLIYTNWKDISTGTLLCSGLCDTLEVDLLTSTGKMKTHEITCFPDPASDFLVIQCADHVMSVELFDLVGHLVYHSFPVSLSDLRIPVSGLDEGFYTVRIKTHEGMGSRKIVVRRSL